jgi:hypothetical protein
MENKELFRRVAQLEFEHDQLLAELQYIDQLLKSIGFTNGLETVKMTAQEILTTQDDGDE